MAVVYTARATAPSTYPSARQQPGIFFQRPQLIFSRFAMDNTTWQEAIISSLKPVAAEQHGGGGKSRQEDQGEHSKWPRQHRWPCLAVLCRAAGGRVSAPVSTIHGRQHCSPDMADGWWQIFGCCGKEISPFAGQWRDSDSDSDMEALHSGPHPQEELVKAMNDLRTHISRDKGNAEGQKETQHHTNWPIDRPSPVHVLCREKVNDANHTHHGHGTPGTPQPDRFLCIQHPMTTQSSRETLHPLPPDDQLIL